MWSSISKIEIPSSLKEAWSLYDSRQRVLFSGGTYLVAEKDSIINTLIDINHLLDGSIHENGPIVKIGAKASLQNIINYFSANKNSVISHCSKWSCPSKNIRNQRTLGGEIAHGRIDSELIAYLYTVNATLNIFTTNLKRINLREWDGRTGIITDIEIKKNLLNKVVVKRFVLIPSAPAFVIIAGIRKESYIDLTIGGSAYRWSLSSVLRESFTDEFISDFCTTVAKHFYSDFYGSTNYKQKIIQIGLKRIRAEL